MNSKETMKKTARRVAVCALSASLALSPLMGLASDYATVRGGRLNLRQNASLDAKVLGQYPTGTWIEVVEKGNTWSKVKVDGKNGYMMTKYLSSAAAENTYYVRTNTGIGLNLRKAPSTGSDFITSYPIGTKVNVLHKGNGWAYVDVNGTRGYMAARFLSAGKLPSYTKPVDKPYTATLININGGKVVNFRQYPGMKTKVLKTLAVGTKVTVLETGENWSKVEVDGQQGYVSTYFLKK